MDVIDELIACCEAWEPEVCVMGNVRAGEAAKALRGLRADLTMAGAFHKAAVAQRNSAWEEIEHLRAELAECRAIFAWLLGEGDEFPLRPEGKGPYWWRKELREKVDAARKGEGE